MLKPGQSSNAQRLLVSTGDFLWDTGIACLDVSHLLDSELLEDRDETLVFFPPRLKVPTQ